MWRIVKYMLCLSVLTIAGAGQLSAQHYMGVRGGYGSGSARFYPNPEQGTVWGLYHGGVSWKYYTSEPFVGGVEIDALYMQQGFKVWSTVKTNDETIRTGYYQRTVNSVMVPLFWQPHIYMFRQRVRVFVNAGLTFSYVMSSTEREVSFTNNTDVKRDYTMKLTRDNRFGYGLCGGGGISYSAGRVEAFAEVRYYIGYSDILKNWNKYEDNPYLRSPLDGLQISAGVYFRLGKGDIKSPQGKGFNRDIARRIKEEEAAKDEAPEVDIFVPDDGGDAGITVDSGENTEGAGAEKEAPAKKSRKERRAEKKENTKKSDDGNDETAESGEADTERR